MKRVVFSILLDYDTMIKKLLSMSKSSKKKKRQKEKFKDSFITVDLVEKIFCNEETGKEWVPIEFDTSKIIKGLPSLPFQGKKKKPKLPRPYLTSEEIQAYQAKRQQRKRGSGVKYLPQHALKQMAKYLKIEHLHSIHHIAAEALLNSLPHGWTHYVQPGKSLSIYCCNGKFLTTKHPRDEDLKEVVADGRSRAIVEMRNKGNALGGYFLAWRSLSMIAAVNALKGRLLFVSNLAQKDSLQKKLSSYPMEYEFDIEFNLNFRPKMVKIDYKHVLAYLHDDKFFRKVQKFLDIIDAVELFDFIEEDFEAEDVIRRPDGSIRAPIYSCDLIDFGSKVENVFESLGSSLCKFMKTTAGVKIAPVWDSSVTNTEMGFEFKLSKRNRPKKKSVKESKVEFLGDLIGEETNAKAFEDYYSDEDDYEGESCFLVLEQVHFVHQCSPVQKGVDMYIQRLYQKLLWTQFKRFEKAIIYDIEATVLRPCKFCLEFEGTAAEVELHEEACPKRKRRSAKSLVNNDRLEDLRRRKREKRLLLRAKQHYRRKLYKQAYGQWRGKFQKATGNRRRGIMKLRRVRLKPTFDALLDNYMERKAIFRRLNANFGRRDLIYYFQRLRKYYNVEVQMRQRALKDLNTRNAAFAKAVSHYFKTLKRKIFVKWVFVFELRRQRLLIFAINRREICCIITDDKAPENIDSYSPISLAQMATLLQPFFVCRSISKLNEEAFADSNGKHNVLHKLVQAAKEGTKISTMFVARIPSVLNSTPSTEERKKDKNRKRMISVELSASRLQDIPIFNLESCYQCRKSSPIVPAFFEVLAGHGMGLSHLSQSTETLNTAITSKSLTLLMESKFDFPIPYNIYSHVRIPRKSNSVVASSGSKSPDKPGFLKQLNDAASAIPMDHFAAKLFDSEKRVLLLADVLLEYSNFCAAITGFKD